MSLQVWLPLNGNLNNNGLSPVSITTTNASFQTGGKIGNCLKLGYSADFSIPSMAGAKQISIAYWVKINTATSTQWLDPIHYYSNIEGSTSAGWVTRQEFYSNCTLTGFWFDNGSMSGVPITVGEWTHFAITVDYSSGVAKMYKNGVLVKTATTVNTSAFITGNNFKIGENGLDISENDVRIYDHILSAKEVEILARGLILHYPLNGGDRGQANLLKSMPKSYNSGSYCAYQFNLTTNMVAGQKYTMQLWDVNVAHSGKTSDQLGVYMYWGGGMNSECSWKVPTGHADYLVATFTAQNGGSSSDANNLWLNIYNSVPNASGTLSMSIGRWKLESGEIATSYIPATTDTEYTTYGYNVTTEYDTSGNGYNATKVGTLDYNANTARYLTSSGFNSSAYNYVDIAPTGFTNTYSFAWWARNTAQGMFWGFSNGNRLNLYMANDVYYWNTGDGSNNPFNLSSTTYRDNNWHHYVVTGDGTTVKLYIDGGQKATAKTFKGITGTRLFFNGWDTSSSYDFNGYLSDFRLYSTTLTAEQVLDLYKSCGSVSDTGRLLTYELVESY